MKKRGRKLQKNTKPTKPARVADCWNRKTVKINRIDMPGDGTKLWLPLQSTFRFKRNDDFCGKQVRRYEIKFHTRKMKDVWKSCWLLHRGTTGQPLSLAVRGLKAEDYPNLKVEYLQGFMPVMIDDNNNGVYCPHVDEVTMEYFRKGDANEPADRVYVILRYADKGEYQIAEGGAASGPPR